MWLCDWCKIYGKYPVDEAWQPDDVEPIITQDGERICPTCAENWRRGKKEQKDNGKEAESQVHSD